MAVRAVACVRSAIILGAGEEIAVGDGPVGLAAFAGRLRDVADHIRTTPVDVPPPGCAAAPGTLGELADDLHRRWVTATGEATTALSDAAVRLDRLGTDLGLAARRYSAADDDADRAHRRAADGGELRTGADDGARGPAAGGRVPRTAAER